MAASTMGELLDHIPLLERLPLNRSQQLYPAEISPIKTRAKANALSTCSNWLFNFGKYCFSSYVSDVPAHQAHILKSS